MYSICAASADAGKSFTTNVAAFQFAAEIGAALYRSSYDCGASWNASSSATVQRSVKESVVACATDKSVTAFGGMVSAVYATTILESDDVSLEWSTALIAT